MTTLLYTHADCLAHDTGHTHPESAARLRELLISLSGPEFDGLERRIASRRGGPCYAAGGVRQRRPAAVGSLVAAAERPVG